jgi:hypothetical protein
MLPVYLMACQSIRFSLGSRPEGIYEKSLWVRA